MEKKKTRKPRTKLAPVWLSISFDPSGGYGEKDNAFEIKIQSSLAIRKRLNLLSQEDPINFIKGLALQLNKMPLTAKMVKARGQRLHSFSFPLSSVTLRLKMTHLARFLLIRYMREDPQGFLNDLDREYLWGETDFEDHKLQGIHSKTHAIVAILKHLATRLYVIEEYWSKSGTTDTPKEYYDLLEAIPEESDKDGLYDNSINIVQMLLRYSPLGQIATSYGLKCFNMRPTDFAKTYIHPNQLQKLQEFLNQPLVDEHKLRKLQHYTKVWIERLMRKEDYWRDLYRLN